MILAVHLMPAFPNAKSLETFRVRHDPLAGKIPPHITLMFPFQWKGDPELFVNHVSACASKFQPFGVNLGPAEAAGGGYLWLPIKMGRETVTAMHDALYSGAFSNHQDTSHTYHPHVTIGRFAPNNKSAMLKEALKLRGVFETFTIHSMVIEEVLPDASSRLMREAKLLHH